MNRHARRALARAVVTSGLAHPVPVSVRLVGGPMGGWVVKPDAPALQAAWYRTWPPFVARDWSPGAYGPAQAVDGVLTASWQPQVAG